MKYIIVSLLFLGTLQTQAALEISVKVYPDNSMVEISGVAARKLYQSMKVNENKNGYDEDGAPLATKQGESLFCSKQGLSKFKCIMYMNPQTGKLTAD